MSDRSIIRVRAVLVILLLAMAILAFNMPVMAQTAGSVISKGGPGIGTGIGTSSGWVQEYKAILARGLDPCNHCFVGYDVGRVPLSVNGYYGYGPWRRPP